MAKTTDLPKGRRGAAGSKTVGVYDRPPQKRSRKPLLIALFIVLAVVLTIVFARLSHGTASGGAGGPQLQPVPLAGGTKRSGAPNPWAPAEEGVYIR